MGAGGCLSLITTLKLNVANIINQVDTGLEKLLDKMTTVGRK